MAVGVCDDVEGRVEVAVAVRVGVRVGVGVVMRWITNELTVDHAPLVPLAVRLRTRHQNVPWLSNIYKIILRARAFRSYINIYVCKEILDLVITLD